MLLLYRVMVSLLLLLPCMSFAVVPSWEILPKESTITFTGNMNNAPTSGKFTSFTGEIHFDPAKLSESQATINVDINSVTTSYIEIANTLKTAEWFNVTLFPKAIFKTAHFTKLNDNTYQATGTLTIRDKTLPLILHFKAENIAKNKVRVTGATELKRTLFGIGQGEWQSTKEVGDNVTVNFTLTAVKN